jgi:hypothetical protein
LESCFALVLIVEQMKGEVMSTSGEGAMTTITVKLPEEVAAQLETEHISKEQLDSFLVAAVKAWLMRRQAAESARPEVKERSWSEAFRDGAMAFVDQLIDENQALFEELARL